ncbi:Myo-inositol 2-dehydrogenase [Oceanicola granulosus HTCC2516]|uniref:Myo-inositol 2-dehydrogenase n=1 Tax=Oceanicola granulosus (strain ATCC BAA-861 / DSM 15982 / KCTC 12143 / HTCC2516) TaxID=314256 RepID=Q2CEN1_OCEGH|nr:Gfo/Idh/MocA family oxidoreductase [Oceanicola granulosus]EAR51101.1 Myo-inositol 2-dehydrogenase [Oceanicola granulosus HTCC2516]
MPLNVGLIGLGEVAQLMHLPLLSDDPRWKITAVCDLSPSLAEAMGARYGAALRTSDPAALIANPGVDVVFILSPDETHGPFIAAALDAGKHVFVEKPATLTAETLRPLLERKTDRVVFVGYMRRYTRPFLAMKAALPEPAAIRHVRIRDLITESPFFTAQTRGPVRAGDVGPEAAAELHRTGEAEVASVIGAAAPAGEKRAYRTLTGLGCHSLSAMRDLFGMPRRVVSAAQSSGGLVVSALFDYGSFLASYEAAVTEVPVFDAGIDVIGQHQRLSLSYDTPYVRYLPTTLTTTSLEGGAGRTVIDGPHFADPFRIELDALHAAITEGAPVRTTLADAMEDLELIAQIAKGFAATRG